MSTSRHITTSDPAPFNPRVDSHTVIAPTGSGEGYWVGACSPLYVDGIKPKLYLYYRIREPRPLRGAKCVIAESHDQGATFTTVWSATKEQFNSPSIEKASLVYASTGHYHLYISYVDPADNRWRIDVMTAPEPSQFDPSKRSKVMVGDTARGIEGVKDPTVFVVDGQFYMFYSYAQRDRPATAQEMHANGDVYNTGITRSHTGLAVSRDGLVWEERPPVLVAGEGKSWDAYCARITSVFRSGGVFVAFYDGARDVSQNFEEQCGVAVALDLNGKFQRVSTEGPAVKSLHKTQSIRYVETVVIGGVRWAYYEYVREDGAHELRRSIIKS